jgi:hypothetical protein
MKKLILILAGVFATCGNVNAKDYIFENHGKRTLVKEHIYSEKDNLKIFKLEGTFKDNAGNFGEVNSIAYVETINNVVEKIEASNEIFYNQNIKAYNKAIRANNELEQGVGKWYFTHASKSIAAIINSECLYSIRYYKDNFLILAKCDIPEKAFKQIENIKQ